MMSARAQKSKQHSIRSTLEQWRKDVFKWYPKLHHRAYFVPPVYMKRINFDLEVVADQSVAVPKPSVIATPKGSRLVNVCDERDDEAQQRVLHCLKVLGERRGEVKFVMSQLAFSCYLGEPCYAAAAKSFPRPVDLSKQNKARGDFDILFIHRQYGLLAAEVKSVGLRFTGEADVLSQEDSTLAKKIQQAAKQAEKSGDVLRHLTSDLSHQPGIRTTLMLPNVSKVQLERVLRENTPLKKDLCSCLGLPMNADPSELCLTSEQLSDRRHFWDVTDDVMERLTQWWAKVMTDKGPDPNMTEKLYEELIVRFAGPATTVEIFQPAAVRGASCVVRSEGEGISDTAERFMDLVLFEEQIQILNSNEKLVYLSGPPGTGKSVVLLLQAERWLREDKDVHIFSMFFESTGASLAFKHSLIAKMPDKENNIHYHCHRHWEKTDVKAIDAMTVRAKDDELYVICDEVHGRAFEDLFTLLKSRVGTLHMWAARICHNFVPTEFTHFQLTRPLRSPGAVFREVEKSIYFENDSQVKSYSTDTLLHTDGPLPRHIQHHGPRHPNDVKPVDCEACGDDLASTFDELHVKEPTALTSGTHSPRALQFGDVFLLTLAPLSKDSGLVRGLRKAGVPVRFMGEYDVETLTKVVTKTGNDAVLATDCRHVLGLESKIVVWIQSGDSDTLTEHTGRLQAFSRATAQLITVTSGEMPSAVSGLAEMLPSTASAAETKEGLTASATTEVDLGAVLAIAADIVSEETVRQADCIVNFKVVNDLGQEIHTFFLNLKCDGGSAGRGLWHTPEEVTGTLTVHKDLFHQCFTGSLNFMDISQAVNRRRLIVDALDTAAIYRLAPVVSKIRTLYQQRFAESE